MHGKQWPAVSGKVLAAQYSPLTTKEMLAKKEEERLAAEARALVNKKKLEAAAAARDEARRKREEARAAAREARDAARRERAAAATGAQQRDRGERTVRGRGQPAVLTLDDLFRKTKVQPALYWLPRSKREVARERRITAERGPPRPVIRWVDA